MQVNPNQPLRSAEGIGLCHTEHMFFEGDRITFMRQMILATDEEHKYALKSCFRSSARTSQVFKAMGGRPVTIRLLDPPLHEFLPHDESSKRELANSSASTWTLSPIASMASTKPTPCWVTVVAVSESLIRKSPRCRLSDFRAAAACYKLKKPVKVVPSHDPACRFRGQAQESS